MDELWERFNSTPNFFVPLDTSFSQRKIVRLLTETNISNIIYLYYMENKQQLAQYKTAHDYEQSFDATGLWNKLVKTANGSYDFSKLSAQEKNLLQQRLKAQLARYKWRNDGFYQVMNNEDAVIRKALEKI